MSSSFRSWARGLFQSPEEKMQEREATMIRTYEEQEIKYRKESETIDAALLMAQGRLRRLFAGKAPQHEIMSARSQVEQLQKDLAHLQTLLATVQRDRHRAGSSTANNEIMKTKKMAVEVQEDARRMHGFESHEDMMSVLDRQQDLQDDNDEIHDMFKASLEDERDLAPEGVDEMDEVARTLAAMGMAGTVQEASMHSDLSKRMNVVLMYQDPEERHAHQAGVMFPAAPEEAEEERVAAGGYSVRI